MTAKRIHILVLGQSNVANHGQGRRRSTWGACWHDGVKLPLNDPIPGGTGQEGSVWTRLAPLLEHAGDIGDFSVTVLAEGGTSMADWAAGGRCHRRLKEAVPQIQALDEGITHLLFHQGERDTLLRTTSEAYFTDFLTLHELTSSLWPRCPMFVCMASHRMGVTSAAVRSAQKRIQREVPICIPGPDTDALGSELRRDDTHFNERGLEVFARQLAVLPF